MKIDKIKFSVFAIAIYIISIFTIGYLTPQFHPDGGLRVIPNKQEILKISDEFIAKVKPELSKEKRQISFESNPAILRWYRSTNRIDEANKKIREQKLSYYWSVKVLSVGDTNVTISSDQQKNLESSTVLELKISQEGKLIGFSVLFNETKITDYLSEDSAKIYTEDFIRNLSSNISFTDDSNKIFKESFLFVLDKIELV